MGRFLGANDIQAGVIDVAFNIADEQGNKDYYYWI
ncbi:hypothetical protein [Coxiella-like endosymbiont]|nr:hypothetical protein [Coxiella-like endosymbiont]